MRQGVELLDPVQAQHNVVEPASNQKGTSCFEGFQLDANQAAGLSGSLLHQHVLTCCRPSCCLPRCILIDVRDKDRDVGVIEAAFLHAM